MESERRGWLFFGVRCVDAVESLWNHQLERWRWRRDRVTPYGPRWLTANHGVAVLAVTTRLEGDATRAPVGPEATIPAPDSSFSKFEGDEPGRLTSAGLP